MESQTRVVIIHGHSLHREGLVELLRRFEHLRVICATADLAEALDTARRLRPHAALIELSDEGSLDVCSALHEARPRLPIVLLGVSRDLSLISRALRKGGTLYLPPDACAQTLASTLDEARRCGRKAGPRLVSPRAPESAASPLSAREREVLRLVARGYANRRIGRALSISENTVRNHLTRIFEKLAIHDRTGAAVHALQRGLLRE